MKTSRVSGIYRITNLINNKIYIGSATCLSNRKCVHFRNLRNKNHHNKKLQSAFNKYGEVNFKFEIIIVIKDKNILIEREQFYLDLLRPHYNICKIAGNTSGLKKSKEERLAMSLRRKGSVATNALETYQIDRRGQIIALYKTTREAMHQTGIWQGDIATVCRGDQHSTGGYIWCYKKNIDSGKLTIDELVVNYNKSLKFISPKNKNSKHLLKYDN